MICGDLGDDKRNKQKKKSLTNRTKTALRSLVPVILPGTKDGHL